MNKKAKKIAKKIKKIQQSGKVPADDLLDHLLDIRIHKVEKKLSLPKLLIEYGPDHRIYQGDNSYYYIQRLFKKLAPFRPKSILDLGSGYGRVLFYGALLWKDVDFYGVEIVPERVKATKKGSKRLGLSSVHSFQGDVTKDVLPKADCFCLMNTFFPDLLPKALKHLKKHARKNPFLLVSVSTGNVLVAQQKWLKEIHIKPPPKNELDFRFFQTKK